MKLVLAAFLSLAMPLPAGTVPLRFEPIDAGSFEAVDIWKDRLPGTASPAVLVAREGDFLVSMLVAREACPDGFRCPVRVYHHGIGVFDGDVCDQLDAHTIDAAARRYTACGASFDLPEGEGDE